MAWSSPSSVNTGDTATAAWANVVVNDLIYLKGTTGTVVFDAGIQASSNITANNIIYWKNDSNAYLDYQNSSSVVVNFDASDFLKYIRADDHLGVYISNTNSAAHFENCHTSTVASLLMLRSTDGSACYIYISTGKNAVVVSTNQP